MAGNDADAENQIDVGIARMKVVERGHDGMQATFTDHIHIDRHADRYLLIREACVTRSEGARWVGVSLAAAVARPLASAP